MYDPLDPSPKDPGCPSCRMDAPPNNVTIPPTSGAYSVAASTNYVDLCPSGCGCYCHVGRGR